MMSKLEIMLSQFGMDSQLERDGKILSPIKSLSNNGKFNVLTPDNSIIPCQNDVIISMTGRNTIINSQQVPMLDNVYDVDTISESQAKAQTTTQNYSIGSIGGNAIVGNGNNGFDQTTINFGAVSKEIFSDTELDDADKQELSDLLYSLNSQNSINKGYLSKFSDWIEKHPVIVSFVGQALVHTVLQQ